MARQVKVKMEMEKYSLFSSPASENLHFLVLEVTFEEFLEMAYNMQFITIYYEKIGGMFDF